MFDTMSIKDEVDSDFIQLCPAPIFSASRPMLMLDSYTDERGIEDQVYTAINLLHTNLPIASIDLHLMY